MTQNLIAARILADSVSPTAPRLTTWLVTMPRIILAEWNTHRKFARNAASSWAIPVEKCLQQVEENPFVPLVWHKNRPGMQGSEELQGAEREQAIAEWLVARDNAVAQAKRMIELGIHKQIANRLIEPWRYVDVLMTCCEPGLQNFFALRAEGAAEPHMQDLAYKMLELYNASTPKILQPGEWHIPYGDNMPQGLDWETQLKIAVARAARLSYENFDGTFSVEDDIKLHDRLAAQGHWSSFEHIAQVAGGRVQAGTPFTVSPAMQLVVADGVPQAELEHLRAMIDEAKHDPDYTIVCNYEVSWREIGRGDLHGNLEPGWIQLRKTYPNECRTDKRVQPLQVEEEA